MCVCCVGSETQPHGLEPRMARSLRECSRAGHLEVRILGSEARRLKENRGWRRPMLRPPVGRGTPGTEVADGRWPACVGTSRGGLGRVSSPWRSPQSHHNPVRVLCRNVMEAAVRPNSSPQQCPPTLTAHCLNSGSLGRLAARIRQFGNRTQLRSQRRGRRFKSDHLHHENRLVAPATGRFSLSTFRFRPGEVHRSTHFGANTPDWERCGCSLPRDFAPVGWLRSDGGASDPGCGDEPERPAP